MFNNVKHFLLKIFSKKINNFQVFDYHPKNILCNSFFVREGLERAVLNKKCFCLKKV
jgi:hypothetical protein